MTRKGIIFTDSDGTLVFQKHFHKLHEIKRNADGTVLVEDPITGHKTKTIDLSVPPVIRYIAESTRELTHRVQERYYIVFATGTTEDTMRMHLKQLDFADAYILEHGGRILDADFNDDPQWAELVLPYRPMVSKMRASLEAANWRFALDRDRSCSLQLRMSENPHRTREEFQQLCDAFEVPEGFKRTSNLGDLTILPEVAGKGQAVAYYLQKHPEVALDSIGMGDDINDLEFLRLCRRAYVPCSALPEVLDDAHARGWYVSSLPHFEGIDEILTAILNDGSSGC